ncbi:hypothetical protein SAMN05216312_101642 [Cohnella sp. OV330]|uniref:hypothetical protein n=1 Tax=Cohnella sp. OV330 TaxID=1855288 RepID=UPI0008DF189D|nr:hypothetical protein [Cohnella sp. OV330]SFA81293.1 hypothetical protein SAMN05216312_101642 [Cohnella sp. OV330]
MQIFATFDYTTLLEIAITELEAHGVSSIYAVPLDLRKEEPRIMDSMHRADGMSFIDKGMILAFMFATVGASKGFVWAWGPVIWGLIGAGTGFALGIAINGLLYLMTRRKNRSALLKGKRGDVILVVTCHEEKAAIVADILWDHKALGLAKTK